VTRRYVYADGSGNRFVITADRLVYEPVRPEQSSTGMYSGGEPGDVSLGEDQCARLEELIRAFAGDAEHRIEERTKGSGLLVDGDTQVLVDMRSPHRAALERELRALLPATCAPSMRPTR
jgi:hypothetical protein